METNMCSPCDDNSLYEGTKREQLAAFFLASPPYRLLPPSGQAAYRQKLRQLGKLEAEEIRQAIGVNRPLVWGNPIPHLQAVLQAAQELGAQVGQPVFLSPAGGIKVSFPSLLCPRLLTWGTVLLLQNACLSAPKKPIWVKLCEQNDRLSIAVRSTAVWEQSDAMTVVQECARVHGGKVKQENDTVSFSCSRVPISSQAVLTDCPTAKQFIDDTLSPLWSGFFAWIADDLSSLR